MKINSTTHDRIAESIHASRLNGATITKLFGDLYSFGFREGMSYDDCAKMILEEDACMLCHSFRARSICMKIQEEMIEAFGS